MNRDLLQTLSAVKACIAEEVRQWRKRRDDVATPPFPADAPCYYCYVHEHERDACRVCIHNPEADIYKLTELEPTLRDVYTFGKPKEKLLDKLHEILK